MNKDITKIKRKAILFGLVIMLFSYFSYFYLAFNAESITVLEGAEVGATSGVSPLVSQAVVILGFAVYALYVMAITYCAEMVNKLNTRDAD